MPLFLLLILYLACLGGSWPKPAGLDDSPTGVLWASILSWSAMSLGVLLAALTAQNVRRVVRINPHRREEVARRYGAFRFCHFFILAGLYLMALYVFGWGWAAARKLCYVQQSDLILPGAELVLLSPFVVALVLSWVCYYGAERALYDSAHPLMLVRPFWSRSAYVSFYIRQNLAMIAVPVTDLVLLQGLGRVYPQVFDETWFQVFIGLLLILQLMCLPWLMRFLLGMRRLPDSALRDRLLAAGKRLDFRCSDIMLWNTRSGIANALVVGMVPMLRYVVLSDRLLEELTPDEVEAVFGHEAGHVKHHHMLYYLGFLFMSLTVLGSAWEVVSPYMDKSLAGKEWLTPLLVGSMGTYIFVVFGFLSRRCERQADIHGCRAVSCGRPDCQDHESAPMAAEGRGLCPTGIRTFIRALDKVASINGMVRSAPICDFAWSYSPRGVLRLCGQLVRALPAWVQTWQHSTIDRRIAFLQGMLTDPTVEPRFQQRIGRVKWGVIIVLVCLFGAIKMWPG